MNTKKKLYEAQDIVLSLKKTLDGTQDEIGEIKARLFALYLRNDDGEWVLELEGILKTDCFEVVSHFCGDNMVVSAKNKDKDALFETTAKFIDDCLIDWGDDGKIEWIGD